MSRFTLDMQQRRRSLILLPLAVLALAGSACGVDSDSLELGVQASVQKEALDNEPCTVADNSIVPDGNVLTCVPKTVVGEDAT